jgi:hypothetical protein
LDKKESRFMNKGQAIEVLEKAANAAQGAGVLSLNGAEAVNIALRTLKLKEPETPDTEQK